MTAQLPSLRTILWLGFFGAILASWAALYQMAMMSGLNLAGMRIGMNMMPMTGFAVLAQMWALMMAAMMLPTLVPTLRAYEDLIASANGSRAGWIGVIAGFFVVWVGFAALISGAQVALTRAGVVDGLGLPTSLWTAAGLLVVVGGYQFTRVKSVCHAVCHSPMHYFLGHWRTGGFGGLRMGLGLGHYCVGCCWGFMALGFVGGTMNLLWMGLATAYMVVEKLPQLAHYVARPAGVALIAGGFAVAGRALALW